LKLTTDRHEASRGLCKSRATCIRCCHFCINWFTLWQWYFLLFFCWICELYNENI